MGYTQKDINNAIWDMLWSLGVDAYYEETDVKSMLSRHDFVYIYDTGRGLEASVYYEADNFDIIARLTTDEVLEDYFDED